MHDAVRRVVALGEIRRAEAEARLAPGASPRAAASPGVAWSVAQLLDALVARGALDEAGESCVTTPSTRSAPPSFPLALFLTARADLDLARGHPAAALTDARAAGDLVSATITNPACCRWRSAAALALAALDRGAEARELAEGELADARRFGIRDAEGAALRTLGLVTGGREGYMALRTRSRCSRAPRAGSSTRVRCSSWALPCDAPAYGPRRVRCCATRSTQRRASERAV